MEATTIAGLEAQERKCPLIAQVSEEDAFDGTMGVCLACGDVQGGVEPDARGYECDGCGKRAVFGIEEAALMGRVEIMGSDEDGDFDE